MTEKLNMQAFAGIIRAPFLLLAPVCVFLAAGLAYSTTGEIDWGVLGLIMFAQSQHILLLTPLTNTRIFKVGWI